MTADNTILGSFRIQDVPPGPVGSQKFSVEFDLDTDGILTVTATHLESGNQHSLTLDSSTSGRLSSEEISRLVTQAEEMRQVDLRESQRVLARSALEHFCLELRLWLASQRQPDMNCEELLGAVGEHLDWIKHNMESSEVSYLNKLDKLKEEVAKTRQTCPSTSRSLNNNHCYGADTKSFSSCLKEGDAALACDNYEKAQEWFLRALNQISSQQLEVKTEAILKVGQTYRGMAENQMLIQASIMSHQERSEAKAKVGELLSQGSQWLVLGLKIGFDTSHNVKIVAELDKMKDMIFDKVSLQCNVKYVTENNLIIYFQFIKLFHVDYQLKYLQEFLHLLKNLDNVNYLGAKDLVMRSIIQYLLMATAEIEKLLDSSMSQMDFGIQRTKEIFIYLGQLAEPIERLAGLETDANLYNVELRGKEFRRFLDTNIALTETIKTLFDCEEMMEALQAEMEVADQIETAFVMIDNIKQAKTSAKNNMKLFCKCKLMEGKIYQNLLFNENKARNCYREVMDIALAQGYVLETWFLEAQDLYQHLRVKLDKVDEEKVQNSRAEIMEKLKPEMEKLAEAKNMLLDEFVNFLFENFPPKHKKNAKKPSVENMHDPAKKKKIYITLCSYYHPDKIDESKFGLKYKVMCEEVAKVVNERYGANVKGI